MIGNGFDLAHGLQTSYMDFFHYLEELRLSISPNSSSLFFHYYDLNEVPHVVNHPISIGIIEILHLGDLTRKNVWCSYFESVINRKKSLETWIDFEKEIQSLIQQIEEDLTSGLLWKKPSIRIRYLMNCNAGYQNFSNEFMSILSAFGNKDIDPHVLRKNYLEQLALFLYGELRRYTFCFELYLACILPILPPKFPQSTNTPLQLLFEINTTNNFLLSFNYTTTVHDRYNKRIETQYIHGKLRDPDELKQYMLEPEFQLSTPLILGFHSNDSTSDMKSSPFLFFEKFFQRILHETNDEMYRWVSSIHSKPLETVIYGHSLDVSDKDLIKFIFESSHIIKIYYHKQSVLPSLITNLVSIFGREEVNRIHFQGKLSFISADLLNVEEPEADYAIK